MAHLYHHITIDGVWVSPWFISVKTDKNLGGTNESFVQQCDLVLANPSGRFDSEFSASISEKPITPNSILIVQLFAFEFVDPDNAYVYGKTVFTGPCQKIENGYLELHIRAGCDLKKTTSAILWDIHEHHGQTTSPIINQVMNQFDLIAGNMSIPDIRKREWFFMGDMDARTILDVVTANDGYETYNNESNLLNHVPPGVDKMCPSLTGQIKAPQSAQSATGYWNEIEVRGGGNLEVVYPGAEFRSTDAIGYHTTPKDLEDAIGKEAADANIKKYGTIKGPTFIFPELNKIELCKKRALNLLALAARNLDVAMPGVVDRSPDLRDMVFYRVKRLIEGGDQAGNEEWGWDLSEMQMGRAARVKDEFSSKQGWVTWIEIQPYVKMSGTAAGDPNVDDKDKTGWVECDYHGDETKYGPLIYGTRRYRMTPDGIVIIFYLNPLTGLPENQAEAVAIPESMIACLTQAALDRWNEIIWPQKKYEPIPGQ